MVTIRVLLLTGMVAFVIGAEPIQASPAYIVIDVNGDVWGTDKIDRDGNNYTFTNDIYCDGIQIWKSGITIDGRGLTLWGGHEIYQYGFELNANNVTIQNTRIKNCRRGVVLAANDCNNIIRRNTIADCNTGVQIGIGCSNNEFYHNNFVDNAVAADINTLCVDCNNAWDNGYTSGGNYWSDYSGVDLYSGPDQNEPKSDGIGDANQPLGNDNIDRFPLMNPYLRSLRNRSKGGAHYTIQEAIDDADAGDAIGVNSKGWCEGMYYEQIYYEAIDVNKRLTLLGSWSGPVIDGIRNKDDVVKITDNNSVIEGFTIQNAGDGKCGINMSGIEVTTISDNRIIDNPNGIKLEGCSCITIKDNDVNSNGNTGIYVCDSNIVLVNENRINSNGLYGILVKDSNGVEIDTNYLTYANEAAILIKGGSYHTVVRGNVVTDPCEDGIVVGDSQDPCFPSHNEIASNVVTGAGQGIRLIESPNNIIQDNEVSGNHHGVNLLEAHHNTISNNVVGPHNVVGIYVSTSDDVLVTGNEVFDCNGGIILCGKYWMMPGSDDCNVVGNVITDCSQVAILLAPANWNFITDNEVMDNDIGIYLADDETGHNKIYHNIFAHNRRNGVAGMIYPDFNWWDDGYPSGGNVWSDHYGPDEYSGPDQDIPGGDGIVDTPYPPYEMWGPNNVDHYPRVLVPCTITTRPSRLKMDERYTLDVNLVNLLDESVTFAGAEQTSVWPAGPPWDPNKSYELKTSKPTSPCVIEPNGTALVSLNFKNDWDWIKPDEPAHQVLDMIFNAHSIFAGWDLWRLMMMLEMKDLAVTSVQYTVEPWNSHKLIIFSERVRVRVPEKKKKSLRNALLFQGAGTGAAVGGLVAAVFTSGVSLVVGAVVGGICSAGAIHQYNAAVDPDEIYEQIFQPQQISVPYEVESLPEGDGKRLTLAALDLASMEQAYERSCVRYEGAKDADSNEHMELQLKAALKYNVMATSKLQEVQFLWAGLVGEMPQLTDDDVNDFRESIKSDGLPRIQQEILSELGLGYELPDLKEGILKVTETSELRQLYRNPVNSLKYLHIVMQGHCCQASALRATATAKGFSDRYVNDVAIASVWPFGPEMSVGDELTLTVEVENHGTATETFNVSAYGGAYTLGTEEVNSLEPGEKRTVTFSNNTAGWPVGYYEMRAEADSVPGEIFTADNNCPGGAVKVWDPCDIWPPNTPTDLKETDVTDSAVWLAWVEPNDSDLVGYKIYRDGNQVGWAAGGTYMDTGSEPNTTYSYEVSAYDVADNESGRSLPCVVITEPTLSDCDRANIDGIGVVDFKDFSIFAGDWLMTGPGLKGDTNRDGVVTLLDFAHIGGHWGSDCNEP
jgi:parallel beta-helix repeat protein